MLLICSYLYTQPNNRTYRSSYYKVPLQTAFFYTILYSTEIDTTLIYNYGSILGRILWDGLLIPRHLATLILFRIFKTSSIGIGYTLLKTVTQLLAIFRPLLLV